MHGGAPAALGRLPALRPPALDRLDSVFAGLSSAQPPAAGEAEGGEQPPRLEALLAELVVQLELGQRRALEAFAEARASGPHSAPRSPERPRTFAADRRQDKAPLGESEDWEAFAGSVPTRSESPAKAPPTPSRAQTPNTPTKRHGGNKGPRKSVNSSSLQSMFSAAYSLWEGSNVSKEPERTPAGSTGAIELIEHDPIGSYDLQGLWLDSAPTTRSSTVWMKMPWSFRRFVANFDCGNSAAQQRVQKLVSSTCYEVCVMLLILANSVYLGWQVEYEAQTQKKLPMTSEVEAFFCIVFTAELAMKMYGMGCHFWTGGDAAWSYFDVFVVLLMVLEFFGNVNQQVSGLRILRVLRVVRFLRSVRQLRFFAQLRIMIRSIMFSLRPLLWASIVLMGMFYLFGLCFTQGVTDHLREHDLWEDSSTADLRRYFGTLHRCALSLFEAMSGGINWGVLFDTLSPLQLRFRFMFLFFVLFAIFGTANVVTGIFVEIANHWARSDSSSMEQFAAEKRTNVMSRLRDLFQDLDTGGDGRLTLEGMRHVIFNVSRGLIDRFHALDLEVTDVRTLFLLLDRDQKGHITLDDFLLGCLRLTGEAKTLDVMKLQYQCEWMMHTISTIVEAHEAQTRAASLVSQQRSGGSPTPASEAEPELTSRVGLGCRSAAEVGHGGGLTVTWCDHQMGQVTDSAVTVGCKRRSSGSKDSEVAV